ncbi:UNVERIFIED_CONTAM: protein CROWDED NUCLEI 4 [Sesamum radiatum]|uniref:Protein CROWDED NUCLEI 4 n=1 Tax=Sesamum radiatum TaxID=300843 RepID=A0AAW2RCJ2_SESRA
MASPTSHSERFAITPRSAARIALSPNSGSARVLKTPLSDEDIWKRLKEAGFDEESIKRRDKAALIAYIAKLEAEIYEHQHHMGLLILERKEWLSKYEEAKSVADSAELNLKRERASHVSDLADAKKREDSLKKALGIEKECVKNIEKTLHEMRTEYAEVKVAAESKFAEARSIMEDAFRKLTEAEDKMRSAKSLEAEASRYHRTAERKLHEVEEREDDLRRRIISSKSDQALLNQREEYVFTKTQELKRFEKELEDLKLSIDKERTSLNEEKVALELKASSLSAREEAVIRRERDLLKKEEEALLLQAKLTSKESDNVQKVISNHEATLALKNSAFEAEAEMKRKLLEDEINAKRRAWELKELDIKQREDFVLERESELDVASRHLKEKEKEVEERLSLVEEKQKNLLSAEEELELKKHSLKQEREEICRMKLDLQKSSDLLEEKRKRINDVEEKVEAMTSETNELLALELRLKEEIDMISAQKRELEAEADHLKAEKAKFEAEWELIDEKREVLVKEAERIAEERLTVSKFLKDEREGLKAEKDAMRDQYKRDLESLSRDREAFMSELESERAEWFSKIQKERADFMLDIEMQKKELNNCIEKRREEIENYLTERDKEFEEEKKKELQHITSLKERVAEELEHVNSEMKRLDAERREINLDREKRDQEWTELNNSIEELKVQREKLEKQRELLRADREEILAQIETLKKLEDLKERLDSIAVHEMHQSNLLSNNQRRSSKRLVNQQKDLLLDQNGTTINGLGHNASGGKESDRSSSPLSAPFSWLKRCADTLLEQRQNNKKRRKEEDVIAHGSEDTTPCSPDKSSNTSKIEHTVMPINHTPVGAETSIYIDKIITIQEVTTVGVERITGGNELHGYNAFLWKLIFCLDDNYTEFFLSEMTLCTVILLIPFLFFHLIGLYVASLYVVLPVSSSFMDLEGALRHDGDKVENNGNVALETNGKH